MLENIVAQYDAEHDAGRVTWIDMHLVIAIRAMYSRIAVLEQQINRPLRCEACGDEIIASDETIDNMHVQCAEAGADISDTEAQVW